MIHAGLVLEGGGMRGIYTAGVLDFFMEKKLVFKNCYGVSAGACHLCSYISDQPKRAYHSQIDFLDNKDYCGIWSFFKTGDFFNAKMCYDDIPNKLLPYNYKNAAHYDGNAFAVVTNVRTGKPEYLPMREMHHDITAVRASASLPLLSKNVKYMGEEYLDGGISDPIPIMHSIKQGNKKNVVVLTKPVGYVRKPSKHLAVIKAKYKKYPKIYELMAKRHIEYNKTMNFIEESEKNGDIFVIRPQENDEVGRIEKDKVKLEALYQKGYDDAKKNYEKMMSYLEMEESNC